MAVPPVEGKGLGPWRGMNTVQVPGKKGHSPGPRIPRCSASRSVTTRGSWSLTHQEPQAIAVLIPMGRRSKALTPGTVAQARLDWMAEKQACAEHHAAPPTEPQPTLEGWWGCGELAGNHGNRTTQPHSRHWPSLHSNSRTKEAHACLQMPVQCSS